MTRVILHPGFHKTATSTAEHMLLGNLDLLALYCQVLGNPQLGQAPEAAKRFSSNPSAARLTSFRQAWQRALEGIPPETDTLISCVDLIGRLPGLPNIVDYAAVPKLLTVMTSGLRDHFGPSAEITLHFSTRGAKPWLRSLWWQNLKEQRLTEDEATFTARFADLADLDHLARVWAADLPGVMLSTARLEQAKDHRLGPAGPLLDLLPIPEEVQTRLAPQKRLKPSPDDEAKALILELNRSDLPDDELDVTKKDMLQILRVG